MSPLLYYFIINCSMHRASKEKNTRVFKCPECDVGEFKVIKPKSNNVRVGAKRNHSPS